MLNKAIVRISLWKIFYNLSNKNKFRNGLNFITDSSLEKNFLLLCGFEKFKEFFIESDILEKLFLKILGKLKKKNSLLMLK